MWETWVLSLGWEGLEPALVFFLENPHEQRSLMVTSGVAKSQTWWSTAQSSDSFKKCHPHKAKCTSQTKWEIWQLILVAVVVTSLCQLFARPWTTARLASLSLTIFWSPPMSIGSVMSSNHSLCHPLLLPSISLSIRVFSNESALCIRWPKYWSLSISPSNEYSGLISFRMDWFDLLAVQGNLKRLLQHHTSKASILWRSAFFTVQLSHWYMTTGKTIAWIRQIFSDKVTSVPFYLFHFHMYFYLFHFHLYR